LGYLAVAHREALVVQSSTGRGEHLHAGLEHAATTLDPVVVIAAVGSCGSPGAAVEQLEAAVQSRATPCFVYDPAGGISWAERFALAGNPQPERAWPGYALSYEDAEGTEGQLDQSFTFAHAAALDPAWRSHFLRIGPEAWLDDQVEIAAYLELGDRERSKRIPYLWVVDDDRLVRAVIRWELAFACRDRARAWRILQELAGTENSYVRRAEEQARRAAREEADRRVEQVETESAATLESARTDGATAAIHRLVRMLADPQGATAVAPVLEPQEKAEEKAGDRAPTGTAPGPPYIDSFLCTTCNDCIDVNPQMFRYDENKQARIADAAAGTFKQLVKAAEACPTRCIHPGAPREGDRTATPALVERAAKFN
jgi:pyruvate-ferredoxin/flavodoxin oxidoreductase